MFRLPGKTNPNWQMIVIPIVYVRDMWHINDLFSRVGLLYGVRSAVTVERLWAAVARVSAVPTNDPEPGWRSGKGTKNAYEDEKNIFGGFPVISPLRARRPRSKLKSVKKNKKIRHRSY